MSLVSTRKSVKNVLKLKPIRNIGKPPRKIAHPPITVSNTNCMWKAMHLPQKTAHSLKMHPPSKTNFFTDIMLNADLFKVLPDVVLLGQESAMVGLISWPTYTHQEVVDLIDMLPTLCTDDFDRVIFLLNYRIYYVSF